MEVEERVRNKELRDKIVDPLEAVKKFVPVKGTIAFCGLGQMSAPKLFPQALARYIEETGVKYRLNIFTDGSAPPEVDSSLAKFINRRYCYQNNPVIRDLINKGIVHYMDAGLCDFNRKIKQGFLNMATGGLDLAVIEAVSITENNGVIPCLSVDYIPTIVNTARKVIVEIATLKPTGLEGIHDIPDFPFEIPYKPIPIAKVTQRIGNPYVKVKPDKIAAIIESNLSEKEVFYGKATKTERKVAENTIDFLSNEAASGRLPKNLLPLQVGVGPIGDSMVAELSKSEFEGIEVWTELMQCYFLDLIDEGKVRGASMTSLYIPPAEIKHLDEYMMRIVENMHKYRDLMVLRPTDITNNYEVVSRLGVIAINQAVEVDIYGFVNSSHVLGGRIINGLGGSAEMAHASYLSIFATTSTAKNERISRVVPMVTHVDTTDHDVDVVITENGWADLRGKSPREKAKEIIERCAHTNYKDELLKYFEDACREVGGHMPHSLDKAFSWHLAYISKGDMRKSM